MGVKVAGTGYQSQMAAEFAGKQELQKFLKTLEQEERRNARKKR
jgi:hypothetical protein